MELSEQIGAIKTKQDLADFVGALRSDLAVNASDWENPTLERFLKAMEAWIEDMDGYYKNSGQPPVDAPTWRTLADVLYASRMYE